MHYSSGRQGLHHLKYFASIVFPLFESSKDIDNYSLYETSTIFEKIELCNLASQKEINIIPLKVYSSNCPFITSTGWHYKLGQYNEINDMKGYLKWLKKY